MKPIVLLAFVLAVYSYAAETCNSNTANLQIPAASCFNDGYVCKVSVEYNGAIRFKLGKTSACTSFETTSFVTYPYAVDGSLDLNAPNNELQPLLIEDPLDNVGALAVAMSTAFIINAQNEKFKVRIIYHRLGNVFDVNSVRLQGISKIQ